MPKQGKRPHSRAVRWFAVIAAIVVVIAIALTIVGARIAPTVRAHAVKALEERYQAKVQLKDLHVSLFPRITVSGDGLELRKLDRLSDPPMITLSHFVGHTGFTALIGKPLHIHYIRLEGLKVQLPHARSDDEQKNEPKTEPTPKNGSEELVIDEIDADGTFLEILPKEAGKTPLQFHITKLHLHAVGKDQPMEFRATLTNPRPPGLIQSTGHFGPWASDEPGNTPVNGHYTFSNADLGVFTGISGTLSSTGDYHGRLNQIEVKGTTDTPNFTVSTGGHPVDLRADFEATVNGTDGNTYLHPVNAHFLQTYLVCNGEVEHKEGTPGKAVQLDVVMEKGRIEDLLRLAVKGDPLMDGPAQLKTKFFLPPGKGDVMSRLQLEGSFGVSQATFTHNHIEEKMTNLSLRAQGKPNEAKEKNVGPNASAPVEVASNFRAKFGLKDGAISFSQLTFQVPGAHLALTGSYGLTNEKLDFEGKLQMEAKVSQAFTGWKSMLLKVADPFFSKHGAGAEVPLTITGTRKNPNFGLQLFHHDSH